MASYQQINNLINNIQSSLMQKYVNVFVFSDRVNENNKLYFNNEDINDTIYISCSNDRSIKLPDNKNTFEKMFKDDK